jgi:DNA-binding response OmpR family regulator
MARILVIDDDPLMRSLIVRTLGEAGHELREAVDGEKGLALALAETFDVVVTDILMPGKEGIETIRELRQARPDIGIVAISGGGSHHLMDFLQFARQFGADQAIAKPFRAADLVAAVDAALRRVKSG